MQLSEWLEKQREWSIKTFGPGRRTLGLIKHIRKELKEIEADTADPMEWVDVMILAFDGAWRSPCSSSDITRLFMKSREHFHSIEWWLSHLEEMEKKNTPYFFSHFWVAIADLAQRALKNMGYSPDEILAMLTAKQIVNIEQREWPPWQDQDKATEHVRGEE